MSLVGDTSILIRAPELRRFAAATLQAAGVSGDIADEWAKCLVWANLRGTDSHGVLRIPRYIELLAKNAINSAPMMRVERRAGAIAPATFTSAGAQRAISPMLGPSAISLCRRRKPEWPGS